jgi:hypothetical protein
MLGGKFRRLEAIGGRRCYGWCELRDIPVGVDVRVPYCAIEATRTEPESLPDILKEEISFDLSLQSNLFNESDFITYPSPSREKQTHQAY